MKPCATLFAACLVLASHAASAADSSSPPDTVHRATPGADGVQHVSIVGGAYFFDPGRVIVKVGVPVELSVRVARSAIPHSFVIQAPEAGIVVDEDLASEAKRIRFTPTAVGSYPYYCNKRLLFFQSHRDKGMEGVLEVVE